MAVGSSDEVSTQRIPEDRIVLDGRFDEAEWDLVEPATDFVQAVPDEGEASSERTEVRILYDSENLYIGASCYVKDPETLVYYEYFRDFNPLNTDDFEIALDTFHDSRNSYIFVTNPLGAKLDIEFSNNGGSANINWDAVWHVETTITDEGFFAEIAIPFRSLRYPGDEEQVWGLNFQRRIRHRNEQSYWQLVPRPFSVPRMSLAGDLTGLHDLPEARNLKVTPYVTSSLESSLITDDGELDNKWDAGLDVKYGIGKNLTLDLTANPDFSNVEADVQQVNLTRFSLFFPEKRPFFLENSTIFDIRRTRRGNGISATGSVGDGIDLIPFFSRTIGLSPRGQPIPVFGGARLTGQIEGGFEVGVLNIHTDEDTGLPGESFSVARVRKEVAGNSEVGFLFTDRRSREGGDFNRLIGTDLHFRFFNYLDLSGLFFQSDDAQLSSEERSTWSLAANWRDSFWDAHLGYIDIGSNFNPGMGFVPRRGIKKSTAGIAVHPRLDRFSIREYSPFVRFDYILDQQDVLATRRLIGGLDFIFLDGATLRISRESRFERLDELFPISESVAIDAGDYGFDSWRAQYDSNPSKRISATLGFETGEFFAGTRRAYTGGLALRPNHHLSTSLDVSHNRVEQPNGDFTADLIQLQVNYGFTTDLFVNAFLQYNTFIDAFSTNLRFNFIHRPLSDLFITYNEVRDYELGAVLDRILAIKYTHLFQF